MWPNLQETAYLVTFTGEILNGKFHCLRSVYNQVFNFDDFFLQVYWLENLLGKLFFKKC